MQFNVNCQIISYEGYLIKFLKFSEVQSKREWRKRKRIRGRRKKRSGGPGGREKGRQGSWWGQIERGQCKLLSAVRNLRMRSWSVVEKFSFYFHFRESYMDRVRWRQAGWQSDELFERRWLVFIIFVNRLFSFLPSSFLNARLYFHVIHLHLIFQHKVSFSSCFISFFLF